MRLRLTVIALYSAALMCLTPGSFPSLASTFIWRARPVQQQKPVVGLDLDGRRGLVLFHHNPHESLTRVSGFTSTFLNKPAFRNVPWVALSCVVCHHRRDTTDQSKPDVTDGTDIKQFQ